MSGVVLLGRTIRLTIVGVKARAAPERRVARLSIQALGTKVFQESSYPEVRPKRVTMRCLMDSWGL